MGKVLQRRGAACVDLLVLHGGDSNRVVCVPARCTVV